MRKRIMIVAVGAMFCAGVLAAAQDGRATTRADHVVPMGDSRTMMIGAVAIEVNGIRVTADRALVNGGEIELYGRVRITLPPAK